MDDRPGCFSGLLNLFFLNVVFDFLQERFGFGSGCSCTGCGCGFILMILFIALSCMTVLGTDWMQFSF